MTDTFLSARWENIIMANYEVSAGLLQPYLPPGLELDHFNNKMYVSLVGFMFKRTRLFHIPIPLLGTFEEINLRFYVKRIQGDTIKRGVVFLNETVPYKVVACLANKLYKEHYTAIPAKSTIVNTVSAKSIKYEWKINKQWNHIAVNANNNNEQMAAGQLEEYIFEHYYGYTKINDSRSQEYKVNHPRWLVNKVTDYSIDCDFRSMYGNDFAFLSNCKPASVIMAAGSAVSVKWKRTEF
jgi:uncharacterized protein